MLGRKNREYTDLFVAGSLGQLIPKDHALVRVHRGLDNVKIQSYLTAAAINLKRLAAAVVCPIMRPLDGLLRLESLSEGP